MQNAANVAASNYLENNKNPIHAIAVPSDRTDKLMAIIRSSVELNKRLLLFDSPIQKV